MFNVENGMLFLNIAIVPMQSASGWFMKPVRFCPFCGTELQSTEAIEVWGSKA